MMPDDSRDCAYDPDEEYPWDCDLAAPGEDDTQDLIAEDDDDD